MPFPKGGHHSEEARAKMSKSRKGKPSPFKGKPRGPFSDDHKRKISEALEGHAVTAETREKLSMAFQGRQAWNLGRHWSEEIKRKISEATKGRSSSNKGKKLSSEERAEISRRQKIYYASHTNPFAGCLHTAETKAKISEKAKGNKKWLGRHHTLEARQKMIKAKRRLVGQGWRPNHIGTTKPTRLEARMETILNKYFPNSWRYVGDGSLILGGYNPDFANCDGHKTLIEVFGEFWHSEKKQERGYKPLKWTETEIGRIMAYNALGFHSLIIWEHELDTMSESDIAEKVKRFMKGKK